MKLEWTRKEGKESERGSNRVCVAGGYKGSCQWRDGAGRAGEEIEERSGKGRGGRRRKEEGEPTNAITQL